MTLLVDILDGDTNRAVARAVPLHSLQLDLEEQEQAEAEIVFLGEAWVGGGAAPAFCIRPNHNEMALNHLIDEYVTWNQQQGLQLGSADEHLFDETLTEAQREWLRNFCARWEQVT